MNISAIKNIGISNMPKIQKHNSINYTPKMQFDSVSFSGKKISTQEAIEDFAKIGVRAEEKEDGTLKLNAYEPHKKDYKKLKNSENDLFELVSEIETYANFENSKLTSTKKLKEIGKSAIFSGSEIKEIPHLEYIGKDAYFNGSKIKDVKNLKVHRSIIIQKDQITHNFVNAVCGNKIAINSWEKDLLRIYNKDY